MRAVGARPHPHPSDAPPHHPGSAAAENGRTLAAIVHTFSRHRPAAWSALVLAVLALAALMAPWLTPYGPTEQDLAAAFEPPSLQHPMGTDALGRDLLTRILYGGRVSLTLGLLSTGVAVVIGTTVGALAGYLGGRTDSLLMRLTDLMLSYPDILILMLLGALLGSSYWMIVLVIGGLRWMTVARLVRVSFLALKAQPFVEAARAAGASDLAIVFRHLLPNSIGPVIVAATLGTASAIVAESTVSFLGLGLQPPTATWGTMLKNAQEEIGIAPWTAVFPGLMIFLTVLSNNFVGDALRDALDPKGRG